MQFTCESCKANLQIADEKVRGKRLVVRCKRCGVQIRIVDPALKVQPVSPAAAAPTPTGAGAKPAAPTATGPIARAAARPSDTESTRAMESEVLEKALRASKAADAPHPSPAPPRSAPPPPPPPRETPAPREAASWFAMIQGKQIGPMAQSELALKASAGQVGPRTYLWKEGMEAWIRAKDVPELVPLFAAPPAPPPAPRDETAASAGNGGGERVELPFDSGADRNTPPSGAARPDAEEGAASPDAPTPPGGMRVPAEAQPAAPSAAADEARSASAPPGALDLARWGAAELSKPRAETPAPSPKAVAPGPGRDFGLARPERRGPARLLVAALALLALGGLLAFALLYGRDDRSPAAAAQDASPPRTTAPDATGAGQKPEDKTSAAPPHDATASAAGLSPEELKRKVDENRPALQGCVDEAVKRDPSLRTAKILISTTIAPSGSVTSARIDQKLVDQSPLGACLKSAARKMQFPAFTGEAFAVDIPIVVTGGE
jgi:predicted Zn finger-like uncharacterized protein